MLKKPSKKKSDKTTQDYEQLGRMLDNIYQTGYIDRNQMYKMSFLKGIAAGFGGVVGATLVVGILIWSLSLLDTVPFIGRAIQNLRDTVQTQKK